LLIRTQNTVPCFQKYTTLLQTASSAILPTGIPLVITTSSIAMSSPYFGKY